MGVRLEVFPYLAEDIEEEAACRPEPPTRSGCAWIIYPHVYRKMNTEWRVQCAGYHSADGET